MRQNLWQQHFGLERTEKSLRGSGLIFYKINTLKYIAYVDDYQAYLNSLCNSILIQY